MAALDGQSTLAAGECPLYGGSWCSERVEPLAQPRSLGAIYLPLIPCRRNLSCTFRHMNRFVSSSRHENGVNA